MKLHQLNESKIKKRGKERNRKEREKERVQGVRSPRQGLPLQTFSPGRLWQAPVPDTSLNHSIGIILGLVDEKRRIVPIPSKERDVGSIEGGGNLDFAADELVVLNQTIVER